MTRSSSASQSAANRPPRDPAAPLRVAVVGGGKMAQHHVRALQRVEPPVRIVAIVDPSPAAREAMQAIAPDAEAFTDLPALLARGEVDIVHVCSPPATHFELTRQCLDAGVHVYCEKPVVESKAEGDALVALADASGAVLCPGHQLLFEPPAREIEALLPGLGRVVHIESFFAFRPVRRMPGGRAPQPADQQLLDVLPHPTYLLLHVFSRIAPGLTPTVEHLHVGADGTIHAFFRAGAATGSLVVTLTGRPVDSYLRVVGTNGAVHGDFVRGVTTRLIGPGTSGIDKALAPYRLAWQAVTRTTAALGARVLRRQRSYPGLRELFEAMHAAVRGEAPLPISRDTLLGTIAISEAVKTHLQALSSDAEAAVPLAGATTIAVTGGSGMLGSAIVKAALAEGIAVRSVGRRAPAIWDRIPGADYRIADIAGDIRPDVFAGCDVVIHAAAETAGGWDDHQRNSIDATRNVVRAAHAAGVSRLVFVGSTAVLDKSRKVLDDRTPLAPNERGAGPYVWGKLVSERVALEEGQRLGIEVKVVRPSALVDFANFDPPGRLGKRIGGLFVAVGSPSDRLPIVDLDFAAKAHLWTARHFDEAADTCNLVMPDLPTKRDLVTSLRRANPGIRVLWLPMPVVRLLSLASWPLQKVLRPKAPAINLARVFQVERYDAANARQIAVRLRGAAERPVATAT